MEILDLHYVKEDSDLGIAQEGVLCHDLKDCADRVSKVKDTVKKINFDSQPAFKEVPSILKECEALEELNISHTGIKEIPDFISTLPNLRVLSCCCSDLSGFPVGIFNSKTLVNLHIRINKNWAIPEKIPVIPSLNTLAIDIYSSAALPRNLGAFENLESLILAVKYDEGEVPELPASFSNHHALKKVSITDPFYKNRKTFRLDTAASILSSCNEIESLRLSGFAVGNGHRNLSMLTGLKELELRHLLVEGNIFASIMDLHNLEKLNIWGSEFKIAEIPDIFVNTKELREFSFAGNMVTDLPQSIYSLDKIKILEIGSTGISELDEKIGNLKDLEKIHVHDNILEKLPPSIFSLPRLKVLNIEENIFGANTITAIKEKLGALEKKGQKIEFMYDRQGHRQMIKKLRAVKNIDSMNVEAYAKCCLNAINENPYAIKYINKEKLRDTKFYAELCAAAVRKTCIALENIDGELLGKQNYFRVCMEAARSQDIGVGFKLIKFDLLNNYEYLQVCVEAALHNKSADFINNFNTEEFHKNYGRDIYERLCWVSVLRNPQTIYKMINPTRDIQNTATRAKK